MPALPEEGEKKTVGSVPVMPAGGAIVLKDQNQKLCPSSLIMGTV